MARIIAKHDNEWFLQKSDGSGFGARLAGNSYVSEWLTLLVFKSLENSSTTYVLLLTDSVTITALRQLKLKLKVSIQQLNAQV